MDLETGSGGRFVDAAGGSAAADENWSCIIANRTGGQGKTLVSQLLYEALREGGVPARLAAVDSEAGSTDRSKLGRLYPETRDLAIAVDLAELVDAEGVRALEHWDAFGQMLREHNMVIDVGANVIGAMLRWAQVTRPGRVMAGRPMNFLVVVTAQETSAADAVAVLDEIEATRSSLVIGQVGVVMNEGLGKFERSGPKADALQKLIADKGYPVVKVSKGHVKAVEAGISLGRLHGMAFEEYQRLMDLESQFAAMRDCDLANAWLDRSIAALAAAGFAPAKA